MEQLSQVQLKNVLTQIELPSQRRLSNADGLRLTALLERAQRRWPNQDTAESMDEYLADFEQLTLKYSLPLVREALAELRIKPGQKFFPRPDECAEGIERGIAKRQTALEMAAQSRRRQDEIAEFWSRAAELMEMAGFDEVELLKRFPSYGGTKPSALEAAA